MAKIIRTEQFISALKSISFDDTEKNNLASYRKAVNACCKREVDYLRKHLTLTSLRSALTEYRNAVRTTFEGCALPVTYKDRHSGYGHIALKYLTLKKEEVNAFDMQETARKEHYLHGQSRLIICNHSELVKKADALLDSNSVYDVAAGLLLLTGRRATEILKTASFKFVDNSHVLFSGQLKNEKCGVMAKGGRDNYIIPILTDSNRIINALARIREMKPLQDKTEKEVNALTSCALGRAVKRNLMGYIKKSVHNSIENLIDYSFLEPKNLRSMYVHIAQNQFEPLSVLNSFAHDVLGHATKGAVDNYMEFMLHQIL